MVIIGTNSNCLFFFLMSMLILKYKAQVIQMSIMGLNVEGSDPLGMVVKMQYQKKLSHKDLVYKSCYRLIF